MVDRTKCSSKLFCLTVEQKFVVTEFEVQVDLLCNDKYSQKQLLCCSWTYEN